jgi:glycosyltransferase involved in cell wall biosynthesis
MSGANRTFHLTDDFSPESGVTGMILHLSCYLAQAGWASTIVTAAGQDCLVPANVNLVELPLIPGGIWRFPRGLQAFLGETIRKPDAVFHLHGVWMGFQWLAARWALHQPAPVLLSPHGMLNRWHLRHVGFRELRKLIYWRTMAYPAFRHLPLIHAITPLERDEIARWLPGQAIEVIPNAINLEAMDELLARAGDESSPPVDEPYILFLGRLHPVKGVELLIEAFAGSLGDSPRRFRLLIVGPESDPTYAAQLKALVRRLGLTARVTFLGPVFESAQKLTLYRHAWAFCAPSHTEVMGLVNLEAAAAGLPVITTHETGLWDWQEGGGLLVHPQVEELRLALQQVISWSASERQERGLKSRQLVERRYSWQAVGPQWLELYSALA